MLKLKTKEIKRKDEQTIKGFIDYINNNVKAPKTCYIYFYDHTGFSTFDIEENEYKTTGYYESKPCEVHVCYRRIKLKNILETIMHEYMHFLQEIEYGLNLSEMAETSRGYFKMEAQADKAMKKMSNKYLKELKQCQT